jgi:hypothetical protein
MLDTLLYRRLYSSMSIAVVACIIYIVPCCMGHLFVHVCMVDRDSTASLSFLLYIGTQFTGLMPSAVAARGTCARI